MGLQSYIVFSRSSAGAFVALPKACVFLPFSDPRESGQVPSQALIRDRTFQCSSASCRDVLTVSGATVLALHQAVER